MANQACIAIGINQYQFFQPLGYAREDAQALRQFLVEQAGWSQDLCLLMTDTSPTVENRSTYPSAENIMNWVDDFARESLQQGGLLWFFFSGCGIALKGEDYLMPLDGNPDDISTAISVRSLFERLKKRGDAPVLVLLDINRSGGQVGNEVVGHQTVELAKQLGIPTVLSAQLDEISYEAGAGLGHGLFAAALVEALSYNPGMTLAGLDQYLRDRVPELSKHYFRPVQTPLTVIPYPEAGDRPILPSQMRRELPAEILDADFSPSTGVKPNSTVMPDTAPTPLTLTNAESETKQGALVAYPNGQSALPRKNSSVWQNLLLWGSGVALVALMIAGVLLRNREALSGQPLPSDTRSAVGKTPGSTAIIQPLGSSKTAASKPETVSQTSSKVPSNSKPQKSQAVLDRARTLIVANQASQFSQAIAQVQKIPKQDPLYGQAQQEIARWSAVIMDLAKGRAQQGNFSEAIAAAQLVPPQQPVSAEAKAAVERWKVQARQQRTNQILLEAAKGLIRENQASSYNSAITAASKIPSGQPGYAEAQKLIDEWSRSIYLIAQSRAAKGRYAEAIQAAVLVPQTTPAYESATKAIGNWKKGKS